MQDRRGPIKRIHPGCQELSQINDVCRPNTIHAVIGHDDYIHTGIQLHFHQFLLQILCQVVELGNGGQDLKNGSFETPQITYGLTCHRGVRIERLAELIWLLDVSHHQIGRHLVVFKPGQCHVNALSPWDVLILLHGECAGTTSIAVIASGPHHTARTFSSQLIESLEKNLLRSVLRGGPSAYPNRKD